MNTIDLPLAIGLLLLTNSLIDFILSDDQKGRLEKYLKDVQGKMDVRTVRTKLLEKVVVLGLFFAAVVFCMMILVAFVAYYHKAEITTLIPFFKRFSMNSKCLVQFVYDVVGFILSGVLIIIFFSTGNDWADGKIAEKIAKDRSLSEKNFQMVSIFKAIMVSLFGVAMVITLLWYLEPFLFDFAAVTKGIAGSLVMGFSFISIYLLSCGLVLLLSFLVLWSLTRVLVDGLFFFISRVNEYHKGPLVAVTLLVTTILGVIKLFFT